MVLRLFIVNALVYLGLKLLWLAAPSLGVDFDAAVAGLLLPPTFGGVAERPWTLVSYMFTQCDFRHLLVNMLWLGGFGTLLGRDVGGVRVLALYLCGGLAAAGMFLLSSLTPFAAAEPLAGASGSVIALTVAAGVVTPGRKVKLTYIGEFSMRQVVPLALLAFFFCSLPEAMAHAGGLLAGIAAALFWRRSASGSASFEALPAVSVEASNESAPTSRDEYSALVAKANAEGYEALLPAEQRRLYELTALRSRRG